MLMPCLQVKILINSLGFENFPSSPWKHVALLNLAFSITPLELLKAGAHLTEWKILQGRGFLLSSWERGQGFSVMPVSKEALQLWIWHRCKGNTYRVLRLGMHKQCSWWQLSEAGGESLQPLAALFDRILSRIQRLDRFDEEQLF